MILLLSYDVQRRGGIERLSLQVKTALESRGRNVLLLCPRPVGGGAAGRWLGRGRFLLALAYWLPQASTVLSMHALLLPPLRWLAPLRALGRLRRRASSRTFCWLHGIEVWGAALTSVRGDLKRCDGLIASSRFTRDRVLERPGPWPPARVVHPCAHLEALEQPPEPLPERPRLLTVARVVRHERYKGHRLVLGALEILRERGQLPAELRWLVVGDGDDRAELERETLQRGLGPWVQFQGAIDDRKLAQLLRHCSLLVLPSAYRAGEGGRAEGEGFGIVYLEAALAGRASIGCRLGGQSDVIVDGETGWLIDPEAEALADCLAACLNQPQALALAGQRARRRALAEFGRERFADDLLAALEPGAAREG